MAHFAQIENSEVVNIIVVSNNDCGNLEFPQSEPIGQAFIASCGISGVWMQTSYNANFRNVYAGFGYYFDATLGEYGEFIAPPEPVE